MQTLGFDRIVELLGRGGSACHHEIDPGSDLYQFTYAEVRLLLKEQRKMAIHEAKEDVGARFQKLVENVIHE